MWRYAHSPLFRIEHGQRGNGEELCGVRQVIAQEAPSTQILDRLEQSTQSHVLDERTIRGFQSERHRHTAFGQEVRTHVH